jgi:diacylglycerol kinase family enzyme
MSGEAFTLLINPHRYPQYIRKLKQIVRRGYDARIIETAGPDDFRNQVRNFLEGDRRYLLVWGGDGTAHLAINAWMAHRNAQGAINGQRAIGFLRGGSGNGIQDSYEVPFSLRRQIDCYAAAMNSRFIQQVDLLRLDSPSGPIYGQLIGVGFDAEVIRLREGRIGGKRLKRGAMARYLGASARAFSSPALSRRREYRISLGHGKYALRSTRANAEVAFERLEYGLRPMMIEIGTRPFYGRMFKVCPDVVCNDGAMDVYHFLFENRRQVLFHLFSLWNGWHHRINRYNAERGRPLIERYEVRETMIGSGEQFPFHIDGELRDAWPAPGGGYGISVGIEAGALNFLVPESFHRKFHPQSIFRRGSVWTPRGGD